jgi:enamine deaminase RidA (YjgF/YER057c/UK114 family)
MFMLQAIVLRAVVCKPLTCVLWCCKLLLVGMSAVGELSRIKRVVKLGGFVNAAPHFVDIPQVINGCSDLMVEVFGETGKHARSAVACPTLPLGVAVEVDGVFEIG